MISIVVVAHPDRRHMVTDLQRHLTPEAVVWDDGAYGANANHRRAWKWIADSGNTNTHALVLEDDVVLTPRFRHHLHTLARHLPPGITSLYLGTGRPPHWQLAIADAITTLPSPDHCWLTGTHLLSAVAYLAPVDLFADLHAATTDDPKVPIDRQVSRYAMATGTPVNFSWPSLVDHRDTAPVITHRTDGQPRTSPRKAWNVGTRTSWAGPSHPLRSPEELGVEVVWK